MIVLFELEFSVNGMKSTSDYAIYGIQWRILSIIACLAGVTLSMNVIANHRQGTKRELLKLHGLPVYKQYLSLISGNIIVAFLMALILCLGMFVQIIIKGTDVTFFGFLMALFFYLLTILISTLFISLLTIIFPSVVAALLGIMIIILGNLRGTLEIIIGNKGGIFGNIMTVFLKFLPPLDSFGQLIIDFFMKEFSDFSKLFSSLFYLWLLIGVTYLLTKVVERNEN